MDRLIYIAPTLDTDSAPTINPFVIHGVSPSDFSRPAAKVKEMIAGQILEALQEVLSEGESTELPIRWRPFFSRASSLC